MHRLARQLLMTMQNTLLTKAQVAEMFSVTPRTINHWLSDRLLPHYRRGNVLRFRPAEIEGVLNNMRVPAAGEPKRRAGRTSELQPQKEIAAL
jgi:Helix-turn-helix domain